MGRKHFQNLKAKEVLDLVVKGTHLSVKGRETAFALRQASRNQTLPDDIRVNYVVKSASRTRITLTLEQMQYIDLRLSQGVKQTQIARERVGEGLSRYTIGRYLKDRDRYYNEEVNSVKAQNREVLAYVDKRLSDNVRFKQIKTELGDAFSIWLRAFKQP